MVGQSQTDSFFLESVTDWQLPIPDCHCYLPKKKKDCHCYRSLKEDESISNISVPKIEDLNLVLDIGERRFANKNYVPLQPAPYLKHKPINLSENFRKSSTTHNNYAKSTIFTRAFCKSTCPWRRYSMLAPSCCRPATPPHLRPRCSQIASLPPPALLRHSSSRESMPSRHGV
jgi:hypothetical protein